MEKDSFLSLLICFQENADVRKHDNSLAWSSAVRSSAVQGFAAVYIVHRVLHPVAPPEYLPSLQRTALESLAET